MGDTYVRVPGRLRVLLATEGLLSDIGGGQSLYWDWIEESPEVDFFALVPAEQLGAASESALTNVTWLPLERTHRDRIRGNLLDGLGGSWGSLAGMEDIVGRHLDIAAAVAGMSFDVVDIPDYMPLGGLLPAVLRSFGVSVERRVVSVHGSLSEALEAGWVVGTEAPVIKQLEYWAYLAADVRYGPSKEYLKGWQARTQHKAFVLDLPHRRLVPHLPTVPAIDEDDRRPELCFVGRQEKWKGPDLFIEYCFRLPQNLFKSFTVVGPAVDVSQEVLEGMVSGRQIDVAFETVPPNEMGGWLSSGRKVIMLPSRQDPFNLVAIEAIMHGCPVILSDRCGVSPYLKKKLPGVPVIEFDPADIMSSFRDLVAVASDYDTYRAELFESIDALAGTLAPASRLVDAYRQRSAADREARRILDVLWCDILTRLHTWIDEDSDEIGKFGRNAFVEVMEQDFVGTLSCDFVRAQIMDIYRLRESVGWYSSNSRLRDQMMAEAAPRLSNGLNRAGLYRWLGEAAGEAGDALHFATYTTRAMRLSGRYPAAEVNRVEGALVDLGLREEAVVLDLMANGSSTEMFDYLAERRRRFYKGPKGGYRIAVDKRSGVRPRVSIVVSLYNARKQLGIFLRELARLSPRSKALVELVFVDSGSQDDTRKVLTRLIEVDHPEFQSVVIYTKNRETIQRAWNRGIGLARGDFLSFLGTDETVRPDAFEVMVDYMDANSGCDWVQGDAIVTNVNDAGSFVEDVFVYHRVLENRFAYLLDTCLVGHVGAMYRKSVHDRCGLYDDSFIGAGDTEFKNRALPQLRVDTIPAVLGTYLNYAAERTTSSAKVELEDIRAWYAFRTPGGIRYLQDSWDGDSIAGLFNMCFDYRKSYNNMRSTDIELAHAIATYTGGLPSGTGIEFGMNGAAIWHLREAARRMDDASSIRPFRGLADARDILAPFEQAWRHLKLGRSLATHPGQLYLLNDNRWQQHNWIWENTLPLSTRNDVTSVGSTSQPTKAAAPVAITSGVLEPAEGSLDEALGPENFDDDYYLALHPDVAEAIASGILVGGWEHFRDFGETEGRQARGGPRHIDATPRPVRRVKGFIQRKGSYR